MGLTFGKWLRQQRRALDLTQQAFADQVGCARITLRRIENGGLKPSNDLALLLLQKIGIPESDLTEWVLFARGSVKLPTIQTKSTTPLRPTTNLPASLSTFIGRQKEGNDIINLVARHRLVTLTGSGGVGKTRLSIQVAGELLSEFPVGVWLVELAPLTDPMLVSQSVCAVLGVKPTGNASALEALIDYLRAKKTLLILDNCEHLINTCAQLCEMLLHACSDLKIIASSREPLNVEGEHAYRVPSLSLPNSKSLLEVIQESEAVRLFVERATASQPDFEINEDNAPLIAQICKRLDGIALAIELAASRIKMFKLEQILLRLDDAFHLLTGGSRTSLPRQQTLRALIDWSYNLLAEEEKSILRRLSVFVGGWTLEAAEAVCGNTDTVELLSQLVDKSLVSVDQEHGDEIRYYLLETVRQYSHEKLLEIDNYTNLKSAHLAYFLKKAESIASGLYTRKMPELLNTLEADYSNFHNALDWAQKQDDTDVGLRLSNSLYMLWHIRGEYRKEGIEWIDKFLNIKEIKRNTNRAIGLLNFYNLSTNTPGSPSDKVKNYLEESLLLAHELNEHHCLAMALGSHGSYELFAGNYEPAQALYKQSLQEARLAKDNRLIGIAIYRLGQLAWYQTEYDAARLLFEDSLVFLRKAGDLGWWALSLNFLGSMSNEQGDWDAARKYYEEALSLSIEARDRSYISVYLLNLGYLALGIGDFDQGATLLKQGMELVQNTPDDHFLYDILKGLGEIARFQGNHEQAIAYYHQALTYPQWETDKANTYCLLADIERLQGQIAEARLHLLAGLQLLKSKADWIYSADYVFPYVTYYAIDKRMDRQASIFFGWIDSWNKTKKHIQPPIYRNEFDYNLNQVREQLLASEFNEAWTEGQNLNHEQIFALAMLVLQ